MQAVFNVRAVLILIVVAIFIGAIITAIVLDPSSGCSSVTMQPVGKGQFVPIPGDCH